MNGYIVELSAQAPALARSLQRLVNDFEYDALQQLLACADTESPP
jgi:hypothetical protein